MQHGTQVWLKFEYCEELKPQQDYNRWVHQVLELGPWINKAIYVRDAVQVSLSQVCQESFVYTGSEKRPVWLSSYEYVIEVDKQSYRHHDVQRDSSLV